VARTHLILATLAHAQRYTAATAAHLGEAQRLFQALDLPVYLEHLKQLATT
jgi:hypothetical protein